MSRPKKFKKGEPIVITIPLNADVVEGIVNGDKVCLSLITKAVQAAIEQGYHLREAKKEMQGSLEEAGMHHCVVSGEMWGFIVAYSKVTGQKISEV
jgi:hypothetical protein